VAGGAALQPGGCSRAAGHPDHDSEPGSNFHDRTQVDADRDQLNGYRSSKPARLMPCGARRMTGPGSPARVAVVPWSGAIPAAPLPILAPLRFGSACQPMELHGQAYTQSTTAPSVHRKRFRLPLQGSARSGVRSADRSVRSSSVPPSAPLAPTVPPVPRSVPPTVPLAPAVSSSVTVG
jgi:hypothetical protein